MAKHAYFGIIAVLVIALLVGGAYADSCSLVVLTPNNVTMNESSSTTSTFTIRNDNNASFSISGIGVSFSNAVIGSGGVQYDTSTIAGNSTRNITVTFNASSVSANTTVTGNFSATGYIDSNYCSTTAIGTKDFYATVNDVNTTTTTTTTTTYNSVPKCDDLSLVVNDFYVNENNTTQQAFYLKNNGTLRFEISEVQFTNTGLELSNYFNEKYAFSGELADIVVKAVGPNVTEDKTYTNSVKVRGTFSDGTYCAFTNIKDANFNVLVKNTSVASFTSCASIAITAPSVVSAENFGSVPFTITNGTDKSAVVYVESFLDVTPTVIALPPNSSISREVTFQINTAGESIVFRPVIDGCNLQSTTVVVKNIAAGSLSSVTMKANAQNDGNVLKVIVEIKNTSNKMFYGILDVTAPAGWANTSRQFAVAPGTNTTEIDLVRGTTGSGNGKVTFSSNGEQVATDFGSTSGNGSLAGLFTLGGVIGGIGLLVLIVLAAIVIAFVVQNHESTPKETTQIDGWERHGRASRIAKEEEIKVADEKAADDSEDEETPADVWDLK